MSTFRILFCALLLGVTARRVEAQIMHTYQGPAPGSVIDGAVASTEDPNLYGPGGFTGWCTTDATIPVPPPPDPINVTGCLRQLPDTDPNSVPDVLSLSGVPAAIRASFPEPTIKLGIPEDPTLAVGPDHVVSCVNSRFAILTKTGELLRVIEPARWFRNVADTDGFRRRGAAGFPARGNPSGDPKVIYDHYAGRWIIHYLAFVEDAAGQEAYYLLSVSDDDNPIGEWTNYALPADVNGRADSRSWADYNDLGFDDWALYICGNQIPYRNGPAGQREVKLRVIPKDQLYATGPVPRSIAWRDYWDLHDAGGSKL
ncbi:MAG: hypothetical protein ACYTGZ_20885, partial [Planctomycetota bacterium]